MSTKTVYQIPMLPTYDRPKEVGVYCRVSTRSQEQLESLAAQVSEMVRFVRHAGAYDLYDVYIDIMSGAHSEKRPAFQRMLTDCENHNINLIVCKSISRFGRNTAEMLQSVRKIKECGVNVYFQLENLNTQDSETEHIMTVIEAYRESENKIKSDNIRMGLKMRALTGSSGLYRRRCYGYCKDDEGNLKVDPGRKQESFRPSIKYTSKGQASAKLSPTSRGRGSNPLLEKINGIAGRLMRY